MKRESDTLWTEELYRAACFRLTVGRRVIVHQREVETAFGKVSRKRKAIVTGRYPHILSVQYRKGMTESFRYPDVVREGILEVV